MQKPKSKNDKSKTGLGVLALIAIVFIGNIAQSLEGVRLRDLGLSGAVLVLPVILFLLFLAVGLALAKKKKTASEDRAPLIRPKKVEEDCHNRLHPEHAEQCSDAYTHWKKQLDGFLAAGIIEKDEYRVLMERHSRDSWIS